MKKENRQTTKKIKKMMHKQKENINKETETMKKN